MVLVIIFSILSGVIGLAFCFFSGYAFCEDDSRKATKRTEKLASAFFIFFSIVLIIASMVGISSVIYRNYLGCPANSNFLEENSVYQLVWQGDIGDKHMAALIKRDYVLELAEESDEEARFYELEQPLPQGVTYFKAVKEKGEMTLAPLSLQPPKKSEEK